MMYILRYLPANKDIIFLFPQLTIISTQNMGNIITSLVLFFVAVIILTYMYFWMKMKDLNLGDYFTQGDQAEEDDEEEEEVEVEEEDEEEVEEEGEKDMGEKGGTVRRGSRIRQPPKWFSSYVM